MTFNGRFFCYVVLNLASTPFLPSRTRPGSYGDDSILPRPWSRPRIMPYEPWSQIFEIFGFSSGPKKLRFWSFLSDLVPRLSPKIPRPLGPRHTSRQGVERPKKSSFCPNFDQVDCRLVPLSGLLIRVRPSLWPKSVRTGSRVHRVLSGVLPSFSFY